MLLDVATLYFVSSLVTGTSAILFMLEVRRQADVPAYRWWGATFLCAILTSAIYMAAGSDPGLIWAYPIGNGLVVAGSAMLWIGMRAFNGRRTPLAAWMLAPVLAVIEPMLLEQPLGYWSGFVIYVLMVAAFSGLGAAECFRPKGPRLQNQVVLGLVWGLASLFYFARATAFLAWGPADLRFQTFFGSEAATTAVLLLTVISSFSLVALGKELTQLALRHAATRDGLTGILNRTEFERRAVDRLHALGARGGDVAVLLLDLDHFKHINDSHGHAAGDAVLVLCAEAISRCLRADDLLCRYGGEEFAALLPGTSHDNAAAIAQRINQAVGNVVLIQSSGEIRPTVSIGLASGRAGEVELSSLLSRADAALYQAKQSGRNRVVRFVMAA